MNRRFKVGIDNYSLKPLQFNPLEILKWAEDNGAEGVSFSKIPPDQNDIVDEPYLKDLSQYAGEHELYLEWGGAEHIPWDLNSWRKKDIFEINQQIAKQAAILDARIVRSCSGGLMRWNENSPMTEALLRETATALLSQKQMLNDHNVTLAIETHFEFTTHELLRLFEMCDAEPGGWLGICLDTMNLLTMLEYPVTATERILPWVVTTHIKDGALRLTSEGFESFVTGIGDGVVDLKKIIRRLKTLARDIPLAIEDHGGSFSLPVFDSLFLSKFPDLTTTELTSLLQLTVETQRKMDEGQCTILEREKWRDVCEQRVRQDIISLQNINNETEGIN